MGAVDVGIEGREGAVNIKPNKTFCSEVVALFGLYSVNDPKNTGVAPDRTGV